MVSGADEIARKALELAEAALGDLKRSLAEEVAAEDLREAWNHLLQREGRDDISAVEQLSPTGRLASELLLAALASLFEDVAPKASPMTEVAAAEQSGQCSLLEEAEHHLELVTAARDALVTAQDEVARLEPQLNAAKVRFGNAIRRLYQAGASTWSIAQALEMSDEAVERVVGTSTASEYQAVIACNFCDSATRQLIAGPGVFICSECVEIAHEVGEGRRQDPRAVVKEHDDHEAKCSFCGKRRSQLRFVVAVESARICDECLDLCAEILGERLGD